MIPRRIVLNGFLCYRDEQVIDFDGCDLWVFSGRNGSGKSAIFDAMTFALFGAHRGGKQDAASLINSDASELSVVFDFDLGSARYRVTRSVRRAGRTGDRQIYRFEPGADGNDRWPALPSTDSDAGFKEWIQLNIGLTYETFIASVLLMQGQAETLIGAKPKERFEVLAGVVDLARYQRLHQRAQSRRHGREGAVKTLREQLRDLPPVEPDALAEAEHRCDEAEVGLTVADTAWRRLVALEGQAKTWRGLEDQREKAVRAQAEAEQLLADSVVITRDAARLRELDAVLPVLRSSLDRRSRIEQADSEVRRWDEERAALARQLDQVVVQVDDHRRHLESLAEEVSRDEARKQAIVERLFALARPMHRAAQARSQGADVSRLEQEVASYPADLDAQVAALADDHDRRVEWVAALPSLIALARHRDRLRMALSRSAEAGRAIATGTAEIAGLSAAAETALAAEEAARRDEQQTSVRRTEMATLLRTANERLDRLEALRGASTCDRCGQPLTPEHFQAELARLRDEQANARRPFQAAEQEQRATKERRDVAEAARKESEKTLQITRDALAQAKRDLDQADHDAEHHRHDCATSYEHLAERFRPAVALPPTTDWLVTTFPSTDDLAEGQRQITGITKAKELLGRANDRLKSRHGAQARLDQARQALTAISLEPGDEAAEAAHGTVVAERAAIERCLAGHAAEKTLAQETLDRLAESVKDLEQRRDAATARRTAENGRAEAWRDESTRARSAVPHSWRDAFENAGDHDLNALDSERQGLRIGGIEERAAALPRARDALSQSLAALDDLQRQASEIPKEAQRPLEAVADQTAEAAERRDDDAKALRARQTEWDALRTSHERRQALEARSLEAEGELAVADTLSRLLGREHLQRELLRAAERGILDAANPTLRELSCGELELRLAGGREDPETALQLEVLVRTHNRTCIHDVAYLSGSQKFRVAVSLALGIGRFARGLHRPIESVIIDEGFGCLDRPGRDDMIEALKHLKNRLARIVLVSHQEEFADAFNDGYRFEVVEGATVARPFHR